MNFFDFLVALFMRGWQILGSWNTVEIEVRGIKVRATVSVQEDELYYVHYKDPRDGIPRAKWMKLTQEQIAGLHEPVEHIHTF